MFTFPKKKKHKLYLIHGALSCVNRAYTNYLDYLNTGKIEYWNEIVFPICFMVWNIAKWSDANTYPEKTDYYHRLCTIHSNFLKWVKYDPNNRFEMEEEYLKFFDLFNKEFTKMFKEESLNINWDQANLKDFVIKLTGYEYSPEFSTFPDDFISTLKNINLLKVPSKAA